MVAIRSRQEGRALCESAAALGWHAIEGDGEVADALILDVRDCDAACLVDMAAATDAANARGAPVAVIAGEGDATSLEALIDSGATVELAAPVSEPRLARALRLIEQQLRLVAASDHPRPIEDALDRLKEPGQTLMLVALSRFDVVNAAFGRQVGDLLLETVYERLLEVPGVEATERLVGPEFAVLCLDHCLAIADSIVERLERPYMINGRLLRVECHVGIAERETGEDRGTLLRRAQLALIIARGQDGSPVHRLDETDDTGLVDGTLDGDLRQAIERGEIEVVFQPQLTIAGDRVVGVEALARWQHGLHGELGAQMLFAVAQRSDYTAQLSTHVARLALSRAGRWPAALSHLRLSINVTAAELGRQGYVETFKAMVEDSGFDCKRLTLELTESEMVRDLDRAAGLLNQVRGHGCHVAIDDFGTGYSSLAYLKALPLDYLKIDKGLTQDIAAAPRDRIVVRSVIDMARSLGLAVVAEGVETAEQLALLGEAGAQYFQGYLVAAPMEERALIEWLTRRS